MKDDIGNGVMPVLVMLAVSGGLGGCASDVDSVDVNDGGIFADFEAIERNDRSIEVAASLKVGGSTSNTFLEMEGGERLLVHYGGVTREMVEHVELFGAVSYSQVMPPATNGSSELSIVFVRSDGTRLTSDIELPSDFSISNPSDNDSFTELDTVQLTWGPPTAQASTNLSIASVCNLSDGSSMLTDGSQALSSESTGFDSFASALLPSLVFVPRPNGTAWTRCEVDFTIDRERFGHVSSAYGEGGRFRAAVTRTVRIEVVPSAAP